jgi:hypothetical protein
LRRLDGSFLDEFFEGDPPGEISAAHLNGLAALEFRESATNPPWTPTVIDVSSPVAKVRRKAWPWVSYGKVGDKLVVTAKDFSRSVGGVRAYIAMVGIRLEAAGLDTRRERRHEELVALLKTMAENDERRAKGIL